MSTDNKVFDKTHENEIGRDGYKGRYDVASIKAIIDEASFVNLAFVDPDGMPQCVPMICATEVDSSGELWLYMHGYHRARFARLLPPETRVCVTATLLDGLVLALTAFNSSMNHRSAVVHGEVVDWDETTNDAKEAKWQAAKHIVEKVMPGRWDECRKPNQSEMVTTGFLKIKALSASAKCRSGDPGDDKMDKEDDEVANNFWVGVVPTRLAYGKPQPAAYNKAKLPDSISNFVAQCPAPSG